MRQGISHRLRLAFLPSSLIICLPITLVYSTSPPVSVCGTEKYVFYLSLRFDIMKLFLETETYQIIPCYQGTFNHSSNKHDDGFANHHFLAALTQLAPGLNFPTSSLPYNTHT